MTLQEGQTLSRGTVGCAGSFEEANYDGGVRYHQARSSSLTQKPSCRDTFWTGATLQGTGQCL